MSETPRAWEIFLELYEGLPRQGPGSRACAARAFAACRDLPPAPAVLDLGCGVGAQTLHLAELSRGTVLAVDRHPPFVERLRARAARAGYGERVRAIVGDMADLGLAPGGFDLVWSEGALYQIGLERALGICRAALRPGGYLAFTEAVWRAEDPPAHVRASFESDHPTMGRVPGVLAALGRAGFALVERFTLPDEAWWDDFYAPMESRLRDLRALHAADDEALGILERLAEEPEMHRRHGDAYAYEFFVARRPAG